MDLPACSYLYGKPKEAWHDGQRELHHGVHGRRQRATEAVVQRAAGLQSDGRHLLLSGDPVAVGEVLAAPSATRLEGVAACLLDVGPDAQVLSWCRHALRGRAPMLRVPRD